MAGLVKRPEKKGAYESAKMLAKSWQDGSFADILDDWKWILTYSIRYKWAIALYLALGILSTSLGLVSSVASKYAIDIITGYQTSRLWVLITIIVTSALIGIAFNNMTSRILLKVKLDINNDIQADIFDRIMDADWLSLNQFTSGDILNRFKNDIGTVSSNAISWLPDIVLALYRFIATFLVIMHYDPIMALIALASAPFLLVISRIVVTRQREYGQKVREMSSQVITFEAETFYNTDTIKSFGIAEKYGTKLRNWQKKFKGVQLEYNLFSIKTNVYMSLVGSAVQFTAFGYCLYRLWSHAITYGTMTLFLSQRSHLSSAFNGIVAIIPAFLNSSISAHRIRELTELPKEQHINRSDELSRYRDDGFEILLENIDFGYEDGKEVITDSTLKASPGEIVALIGPSGEGKTTLVRMILGLIRPERGRAVIKTPDQRNGLPSDIALNADTRYLISYVPQGNTILSGTVAENLRMAREEASDEELIEALKTACAWDFIKDKPGGINTRIGERGRGFSEGQAQRIAIARAVLRDAPILLLDEATSALDVATERDVLRSIMRRRPNITCIVTTHRPTVLGMCERVYRVIDTKIVELDQTQADRMAMDF